MIDGFKLGFFTIGVDDGCGHIGILYYWGRCREEKWGRVIDFQVNPGHFRSIIPKCVEFFGREAK